jgi:hypothetical protein
MRNTADVTDGKPIAVLLQPILGVSAINPLIVFYDIHGGKKKVIFFYFVPDTTRDSRTPHDHHIVLLNREIKHLKKGTDLESVVIVLFKKTA